MPAPIVCTVERNIVRATLAGASRSSCVLRGSSKAIDKTAAKRPVWWRWASPDPGCGMAVELSGGDTRDVGDVVGVGQRRAGEGCAPKNAPPACDQIEPGGASGNEGVVDPRVGGQPVPDGTTGVAGQVIGNQGPVGGGGGVGKRLQQRAVARVGARRGRL